MDILDIIEFWNRVKYLIRTHKTTQDNVAQLINIPVGTLRNWIYQNRVPDVGTACNLAVVLGVSVDFLVFGKERNVNEERMNRLLERKTAAARINKLAQHILDQSSQI